MWLLRDLQKSSPKKIHKGTPALQSCSDTIKELPTIRFATLFKRHPLSGVSKPAVCRSSTKQVFLNNSRNSQENTQVGVTFLRTPCFTEHLQWLLVKVSGCKPAASLSKRLGQKCFFCNFAKFLRTSLLLTEHVR